MIDIAAEVGDARNTLLCAPSMSADAHGACTDLLVPANPGEANVLWVSYRRDAAGCFQQWQDATDRRPRDAAVIVVGDSPSDPTVPFGEVDSVSNPSDLTGLGIAIGTYLSQWDGDVVACVDSLTAMLQYVSVEMAYEFLHAITGQLYAADARAHFHLDPTAHDERTVDTLTSLFDAAVTLGGDDPSIRTRTLLQ